MVTWSIASVVIGGYLLLAGGFVIGWHIGYTRCIQKVSEVYEDEKIGFKEALDVTMVITEDQMII